MATYNTIRTDWTDCTNYVFLAKEAGNYVGIIEMRCFKNKKEAYIWNLHVKPMARRQGIAKHFLHECINTASSENCSTATLEWDKRDSPQWVFDWYEREGFEESQFGNGYAFMKKDLTKNRKNNETSTRTRSTGLPSGLREPASLLDEARNPATYQLQDKIQEGCAYD